MKDTTSNMVAPLNPLELTAAQVIRNFIQTHNLEDLNAGTSRKPLHLRKQSKIGYNTMGNVVIEGNS